MTDENKNAATESVNESSSEHYSISTIKNQLDEYFLHKHDNYGGLLYAISRLPTSLLDEKHSTHHRRLFQNKIQKHHIKINENFLDTVKQLKVKVDEICDCIDSTKNDIQSIEHEIQQAKLSHRDFLDIYHEIQDKGKCNDMKQHVAKNLLEMYHLCVSDVDLLKKGELNATTFAVLDKLSIIKTRLPLLKAAGYKKLYHDVTDKVTHLEKLALDRIYKWALELLSNSSNQNNLTMKNIMRALRSDEKLLNDVLDQYCANRRITLTQMFVDVLMQTADDNRAPIGHASGNTKMYVTDILAWIHQHIPIEQSNLTGLLQDYSEEVIKEKIPNCLASITSGICNTIRIRIDNVIALETSPVLLYNIVGILQFYTKILSSMVPNSLLESTLEASCELCEFNLWKSMQNTVQRLLLEKMEPPMADLKPTIGVNSLLNFLTEMLPIACYTETKRHYNNCIMKYTLEPLLHVLNITASRLSTVDMAVYLLNCFHQLNDTLSSYEYIDEWLDRMRIEIDNQIDTLTSEQTYFLVANLNLSPIYNILQNQGKTPLSQLPGMDEDNLMLVLNTIDKFSRNPNSYILPRLRNVSYPIHRTEILQRSIELIIATYKQLYNCVADPANLYKNPKRLLSTTPQDLAKRISNQIEMIEKSIGQNDL